VTARRLWLRRNAVSHGEQFTPPNQLIWEVRAAVADFEKANLREHHDFSHLRQYNMVHWQPPPANTVKINWDAAVDNRNGRIGLGCIAWNSEGVFLAGRSITKETVADSMMAEAIAAMHAVLFGKERGYKRVIFEGDALRVIQAINDSGLQQSCFRNFVEGIRVEMQFMEQVAFIHVVRGANDDAHILAKLATTNVMDSTWVDIPPPSICDVFRSGS
jgi:ribonuclease HI